MTNGTRGLLALAAVFALSMLTAQPALAEGTLTGDIRASDSGGGVALVHWSGGSIDALQTVAEQEGCDLSAVWVAVDGKLVGYFVGAPPFVNVDWSTLVGPAEVEAGPLLLRCTTPELGSCVTSDTTFDHPAGTVGFATAEEAVKVGVATLSDVPEGRLASIGGTELDANGVVHEKWGLTTLDGFTLGRFLVVRNDLGWLLSTAEVCVFS